MLRSGRIVGVAAALLLFAGGYAMGQRKSDADRVYELRIYTTHEGRLEALHRRFRDHTCGLFKKHGMRLVGFWVPVEKPESANTMIYVLEHASMEAAKKSWAAFRDDPEWKRVFAESHRDGPIVSKVEAKYMKATDYSPGAP